MRGAIVRSLRAPLLASTAILLTALPAAAQSVAQTWNGSTSTDWFDGNNWDSTTVPAPIDSATLDTITPNPAIASVSAVTIADLNVGFTGTGALTVNTGADFTVTNLAVIGGAMSGPATSADGAVVVDGLNTTFNVSGGTIVVGATGTGTFTVQNEAVTTTVDSYVGHLQGANGTVTVSGAGSQWNNSGDSFVGNFGTGVFNVTGGGAVAVTGSTFVGVETGGAGTLNISGSGSSWTTTLVTALGGSVLSTNGGSGTVNVSNGGTYVANNETVIGFKPGGSGVFNVSSGASVQVNNNAGVYLGFSAGSTGSLTIDNATWDGGAAGDMIIGGNTGGGAGAGGTGIVTVRNGSALTMQGAMYLGRGASGGDGTLNVSGPGSTVTLTTSVDSLFVGHTGSGVMNITNGASVTNAGFAYLGNFAGALGVVNIDGSFSTWTSNGPVVVIGGNQSALDPGGTGIVNVRNGGTFNTNDATLGFDATGNATGIVNVTGPGSTWNAAEIFVGDFSIGFVNITNGGRVNAASMFLGECNCSSGTVNISGGSTLNLTDDLVVGNSGTGTMTVSGPGTTVSAGGMLVVGVAATGSLTIANGASVTANGVLLAFNPGFSSGAINVTGAGSTLTSTGAIGIGSPDGALNVLDGGRVDAATVIISEGRITIGGGSSLNGAGLLLTGTATTTFGLRGSLTNQINVGANPATLDGALVITGRNVGRTTYTLVRSGDLTGSTFSSVSFDPLLRNPVLSYTTGDVLLTVDPFLLTSLLPGTVNTNQRNVAQAIDNALAGGAQPSMAFENIFFLPGPELLNTLSQLSGEPGAGVQQSVLTGAGMFMGSVFDHAFGSPAGGAGAGGAPLGYAPQRQVSRQAAQAYAAVTPKDRPVSFEGRWSVWAAGYGGSSRISGDNAAGSHDTTSRVYGVTGGATYRASADSQLGFALGGAGSSFGIADGLGSGTSDSFNAALYGHHAFGPAYMAAALGYSWQDASTDRTVTAGGTTEVLRASFRPQALVARLEGGRRFEMPVFSVTPYAAVQTTTLFMPAYAEFAASGPGLFALSYDSSRATTTRGELGARFDTMAALGDRPLMLRAKAAWAHDWNNDRTVTATFQQLPGATFTVNGATPAANAALLSFGADLALGPGWTVGAGFDGEFSRTNASYAGKGNLRYSW